MIDLTPLDVRKKRGDFAKALRGYEPGEVDHFLELVAERLEELVKENLTLRERVDRLGDQVHGQEGREKAVQEALVTAQELREEIRDQAHREAEMIRRDARTEADGILAQAERTIQERRRDLLDLDRARARFLRGFRTLLERELDAVEVEEASPPAGDFDLEAIREAVAREAPGPVGSGEEEPRPPEADRDPLPPEADRDPLPLDALLGEEEEGEVDERRRDDLFSPDESPGEEREAPPREERAERGPREEW